MSRPAPPRRRPSPRRRPGAGRRRWRGCRPSRARRRRRTRGSRPRAARAARVSCWPREQALPVCAQQGAEASHPRRRRGHQADSGGASATGAARLLLRRGRPRRGLHAFAPAELELAVASSRPGAASSALVLVSLLLQERQSAAPGAGAAALRCAVSRAAAQTERVSRDS